MLEILTILALELDGTHVIMIKAAVMMFMVTMMMMTTMTRRWGVPSM